MRNKTYWKDIFLSFTQSKGRFFSIVSLMMIGAIALVGLKVTAPNMEKTADQLIQQTKLFDLAVMGEYGLDQDDVQELSAIKGATVSFDYLTDQTIEETDEAIRIFSKTDTISLFQLVEGDLPQKSNHIVLDVGAQTTYKIGEEISLAADSDSPLKHHRFRITGFVQSPEIWNPNTMGSSTAGSGELSHYAVVLPDAFDSAVYMIARLRFEDMKDLSYHEDNYRLKMEQHQKELEDLLSDNDEHRLTVVKQAAQSEIDEGKQEISESEQKLHTALKQLQSAEGELQSGKSELAAAKERVHQGEVSLESMGDSLASAKRGLDETAQTLETTRKQLLSSESLLKKERNRLDQAAQQLTQIGQQLESKRKELEQANQVLGTLQSQLEFDQANLQSKIDEAIAAGQDPDTVPEIQALRLQIQESENRLSVLRQEYEAGLAAYQTGVFQYESQTSQYHQGEEQYQTSFSQFKLARSQYDIGLKQYQEGVVVYEEGMNRYETSRDALERAKKELEGKEQDLSTADEALGQSKENYQKEEEEARRKIAAAKEELSESTNQVNRLEKPAYRVYSRSTIPGGNGYDTYLNATKSISSIGDVFPVVLYLVAALVVFTTMTRFVDEERTNAGILKALGYRTRDILKKFLLYGLVASFIGTLVGIALGHLVLSPIISQIITSTTIIGKARGYFYPSWTLLAFAFAALSAVLPAFLVARREMKEEAAYLLQSKPPVSGSRILLEKIPGIWKRMSFTHKVTARNIFRYKLRMFMTIFGVAGSVALLFAGLGIRSSISGVVERQFDELIQYDMLVLEDHQISVSDQKRVEQLLSSKEIEQTHSLGWLTLTESIDGVADKQTISVLVTDKIDFTGFLAMEDLQGNNISLDTSSVVLSNKLAQLYQVQVGDHVPLTLEDKQLSVRVGGISEMYAGHFIYMHEDYYERLVGKNMQPNAHLVVLADDSTPSIRRLASHFLDLDGVEAVVQNTATRAAILTIANSLETVMFILIVLSILLAVVILYNLTNINVAERIRELSTIKVLGFHHQEVTLYIYRETVVLSILGILLGLLSGLYLHRLMLSMIGTDALLFNPEVPFMVYVVPIVAILAILLILGWIIHRRLARLDMLEALKSVE